MPSERKNMEGRERKKSLKTSILFLCRSLASVGVGSISPEDVRQAKFNVDGPRIQLWKALHDLVVLSQNNFCGKVARALKAQSREQAEVVIEYATVQLDVLGCPFISAFDHPARVGSRRLLLALAWLIARTKVLEVIMERAIHNLEKASPVTHCPTISPQDTLFCHHTAQRCERAHSEARTFVEAIKAGQGNGMGGMGNMGSGGPQSQPSSPPLGKSKSPNQQVPLHADGVHEEDEQAQEIPAASRGTEVCERSFPWRQGQGASNSVLL